MEERKEETKKGTEGRLVVGMAVAVLVVILCLMLDLSLIHILYEPLPWEKIPPRRRKEKGEQKK